MNANKLSTDERIHFADRLRGSLVALGRSTRPVDLARAYNLRSEGPPVTTHAVRKWLMGEAIPTHEKLQVLARFLNVQASWLRFGEAENGQYGLKESGECGLSSDHRTLIYDVALLPEPAQRMVRQFVDLLMGIGK